MGRSLNLVRAQNPGFVWKNQLGEGAGDPLELGPATDPSLIATAELHQAAVALAQMARHAGDSLESHARGYDEIAAGTRAAFAQRFVLPDGKLRSDTQTAYALAIAMDLLAPDARATAGRHLVAAIERSQQHLDTGVLGSAYLLPALSLVGRDDVAYRVLMQPTCPSWLCSVKNGATTVWEHWDGFTPQKGFRAGANSLNHYAFGAVATWMYDAIGGVALDPQAPGGRHVFIRPRPGGGLTFGRARYDGPLGPISTSWQRDQRGFRLRVGVPAGCTATVTLPVAGPARESGRPLAEAPGISAVKPNAAGTTLIVVSGNYDFQVEPAR
jgi:alpha-L-rhamnosidase